VKKIHVLMAKYRWVIIAAVCVAIGLAAFGWFNNPTRLFSPVKDSFRSIGDSERPDREGGRGGGSYVPDELVGTFDDEEQAKACAELYGIELLSFSYGVAVFKVEGDPKELIAKGKENGWPELSLNHIFQAF